MIYDIEEKKDQYEFFIGMPIYNHYNDEDNIMRDNMHVDLLLLKVQYGFTTGVYPPKFVNVSSTLAH